MRGMKLVLQLEYNRTVLFCNYKFGYLKVTSLISDVKMFPSKSSCAGNIEKCYDMRAEGALLRRTVILKLCRCFVFILDLFTPPLCHVTNHSVTS